MLRQVGTARSGHNVPAAGRGWVGKQPRGGLKCVASRTGLSFSGWAACRRLGRAGVLLSVLAMMEGTCSSPSEGTNLGATLIR